MRILGRVLLGVLVLVIGVPVLVLGAALIGLNTGAGRALAVKEINRFAGPTIAVAGLGGHFPADLKLAQLRIADADGVWASAGGLELRWRPLALLRREAHVLALSAADIEVARPPAPAPAKPAKPAKKGGGGLPHLAVLVDRLDITRLALGAKLAGAPTVLSVQGGARLQDLAQLLDPTVDVALDAIAADSRGDYRLHAALTPKTVGLDLTVAEPPDGLLGHFAGPQIHDPLALTVSLHGPRRATALRFAAALGQAKLNGAGTLDLDPQAPAADVVLTVPALAPVAAVAGQALAGATTLHLVTRTTADHGTEVALDGTLALTAGPGPAATLVGPDGTLSLAVGLDKQVVTLRKFAFAGAGVTVAMSGTATTGAAPGFNLATHLALKDVALLAPGLAGHVAEDGTLAGNVHDFAVNATLGGVVTRRGIPSGPLDIVVAAAHLPKTPIGTLAGTGVLENAPLRLDAAFSRDASGNALVKIATLAWRSLTLQANLALAAGQKLPTGTATFAVRRLADFASLVPLPLAGSVAGNFAHRDAQNFALNVTTSRLTVSPSLGPVDASVNAAGPLDALGIKLAASTTGVLGSPAKLAARGTLNLDDRSLALAAFQASWRTLTAVLLGPASVETKPGVAVRHLALAVGGGTISLDGTVSPNLRLRLSVAHLPVSLARLAAPSLNVTGTLTATADLAGTTAAPSGRIVLHAEALKLHSGPAAAVPPANINLTAVLARQTASLDAAVDAGPNVALAANGQVPLNKTGALGLHLGGRLDLRLLDPILAAQGSLVHGVITPDVTVTGTAAAPQANGTVVLADGTISNIGSGLSLTGIGARLAASGRLVTLQSLTATAGHGTITGHGTVDLGAPELPVDFAIDASNASPIASDLLTESLNAALTLKGALKGKLAFGGSVDILKANVNIPKSLPPSVANLPIVNRGAKPPPPAPPPPDVALALKLRAANRIFIRGDGLFAELGGDMAVGGTAAAPDPEGGFTLIRGYFALASRTLQFTQGSVSFNGAGFMPTLDLEASQTTGTTTATLIVGGTAAKPTITLKSTPPLPSDEVLSQLLFGQATASLSPFQAASLAAALASLSGVGGGADPLNSVRNALGLDQLSLGGSGSAPTVQAGRYVAPGVYVGAQQGANGGGSQATVQVNLYKGLKLTTTTGASTTAGSSGDSSSVGLTYQFNY